MHRTISTTHHVSKKTVSTSTTTLAFTGRKASKRTHLSARHAKLDAIRQAEARHDMREGN